MTNQKGFANIAVVILVVVIAAGLGYFAFKNQTQNQTTVNNQTQASFTDETANWQTYRNEKYRFEFKYPSDGKYTPTNLAILKNSGAVEIHGVDPSQILYAAYFSGRSFEFSIYVSNSRNCENEATWLPKEIRDNNNAITSRSSVVVGNTKSPTVAYEQCGSSATPACYASISVCIPRNPAIAIDFTDGKEDSRKPTAELVVLSNKILSTFKFAP